MDTSSTRQAGAGAVWKQGSRRSAQAGCPRCFPEPPADFWGIPKGCHGARFLRRWRLTRRRLRAVGNVLQPWLSLYSFPCLSLYPFSKINSPFIGQTGEENSRKGSWDPQLLFIYPEIPNPDSGLPLQVPFVRAAPRAGLRWDIHTLPRHSAVLKSLEHLCSDSLHLKQPQDLLMSNSNK